MNGTLRRSRSRPSASALFCICCSKPSLFVNAWWDIRRSIPARTRYADCRYSSDWSPKFSSDSSINLQELPQLPGHDESSGSTARERNCTGPQSAQGRESARRRGVSCEKWHPFAIVLGCSDSRVPVELSKRENTPPRTRMAFRPSRSQLIPPSATSIPVIVRPTSTSGRRIECSLGTGGAKEFARDPEFSPFYGGCGIRP